MDELRALWRLSAPLLLTQLGSMMLGVVDTAIVGRLGEVPLGAVGLGNVLFFTVLVLGFGWMLALDPLVSQALGAGERERAGMLLWQGRYVGLLGAAPLGLLIVGIAASLELFGVDPETVADARPYLFARLAGLAPALLLMASRSFLQAHSVTRPLITSVVIANVINFPLTWLLVFGGAGLPGLGALGAGIASAVATVVQLAVLWAATSRMDGTARAPAEPAVMRRILRLGTPIGLQLVVEVGSFGIVAVLAGNLGTLALGAHNVAMTLISVTFQVAVAVGAAGSVRVGKAIGRGDGPGTRRAGLTAIGSIAVVMGLFSVLFLVLPRGLARTITDEGAVIAATVPLLAVAAAFQLSDGVQAVAAGTLRGAGDTRWPLVANVVGHYGLGVPLGAGLAFALGWGVVGLWWGLAIGLTAVALALTLRFAILSRRRIDRVE